MGTDAKYDEYVERMVTAALTGVEVEGMQCARLRSQIGHIIRQVESDTRHQIIEHIELMRNEVNGLRPI